MAQWIGIPRFLSLNNHLSPLIAVIKTRENVRKRFELVPLDESQIYSKKLQLSAVGAFAFSFPDPAVVSHFHPFRSTFSFYRENSGSMEGIENMQI